MSHKGVLSSKFNMSFGFIPVIISILLYEFITQDISIYIGAGAGVLYSIYTFIERRNRIPHFLLYGTTIMLLLLALVTLVFGNCCPSRMFPLTLEISAIIPAFFIYANRKASIGHRKNHLNKCCKQQLSQGAVSATVSTRVVLIIAIFHFVAIAITLLIAQPLSNTTETILFQVCPPAVFLLSILFNQFGIHFFNRFMEQNIFMPIVNTKGDVVGKCLATDAINKKNTFINPVIRIAVSYDNLLYLQPRSQRCIMDKNKIDIPLECYLLYGETLEQGVERLLTQAFPTSSRKELHFSIMYHFENKDTNRLIYLFLLDIKDEIIIQDSLKEGKLWTLQQIEFNLNKKFFSSCFEYEYDYLKSIICTREKYKEF
ncbi:MAG: hypothetical protein LKI29_06330 [Bacteroides sp.]|jgi:hypothetical protein|nr:hypothetical protein [Bacteroides sp.]